MSFAKQTRDGGRPPTVLVMKDDDSGPPDPRLPPLPGAGATADERGRAIEARIVARSGAPSLDDFRRAYVGFGADWPGDTEVRRRHFVSDTPR